MKLNHRVRTETVRVREGAKGASLVEYALLVALIAIIAIAAVQALGRKVSAKYSQSNSALS